MEEQLISFETAKLAKEKGFKSATSRQYNSKGEDYPPLSIGIQDEEYLKRFPAPTQSLLQKWLREKHSIQIEVLPTWGANQSYLCRINRNILRDAELTKEFECLETEAMLDHFIFDTYEEALEKGLQEALKLI